MVTAPLPDGVNVALYTEFETAAKSLKAPLVTVISPTSKSVVASLDVKVSPSVASLVEAPSLTTVPLSLAAVMVIVGAIRSSVQTKLAPPLILNR